MSVSICRSRRSAKALAAVSLAILGALVLSAQTDMTGYWAFRVKDGGVSYMQLQQTGETLSSVTPPGRPPGRDGALSGTLHEGKLHLTGAGPRQTVYDGVVESPDRLAVTMQSAGRDPVKGTLVFSNAHEIAIRRSDPRAGEVVVHFPRAGFNVVGG